MFPQQPLICFACFKPAVDRGFGVIACDGCFEYSSMYKAGSTTTDQNQAASHITCLTDQKCVACDRPADGFRYGVMACNTCKHFFRSQVLIEEGKRGARRKEACEGGVCKKPKPIYNRCTGCRFEFCKRMGMSQGDITHPKRVKKEKAVAVSTSSLQSSSQVQGAHRQASPVQAPSAAPMQTPPPTPVHTPPAAPVLAPPPAHPDITLARQELNMMGPCRVCGTKADGVMGMVITCTPCRNVIHDYRRGSRFPDCHAPLTCAADWITACNRCKFQKFLRIGKEYSKYKGKQN